MKTEGKFILNGTELVPVYDLIEWANWIEVNHSVASDKLAGGVKVLTTFFGFDMKCGTGKPALFETMVLGRGDPYAYGRYSTHEEAIAGHASALQLVRSESNQVGTKGNE